MRTSKPATNTASRSAVKKTITVVDLQPGRVLVLGTGAAHIVNVRPNQPDDLLLKHIAQLLDLGDERLVRTTMLEHKRVMETQLSERFALSGRPSLEFHRNESSAGSRLLH